MKKTIKTPLSWIKLVLYIDGMIQDLRNAFLASGLYGLTLDRDFTAPRSSAPVILSVPLSQVVSEDTFEWLTDLTHKDLPLNISDARARIARWLDINYLWDAESWRPEYIGDRLTYSLTYFDLLCTDAPTKFQDDLALSLNRQARHLFRVLRSTRPHVDVFRVWRGAIIASLYLRSFSKNLHTIINALVNKLPESIYPDGGHFSRQPHLHLEALGVLIHIREILIAGNIKPPESLKETIDRMVSMLQAYLHKDGGLALFNGASESSLKKTKHILKLSQSQAKALATAPHTGFFRVTAQRSLLVFDAGTPVNSSATAGHAGTLSFEFSVNRQRFIVNCGGMVGNKNLTESLRATAAHSTLTMANTHSSDILTGTGFGARRARIVNVRRREKKQNVLIEASHSGYFDLFGIIHHRLIYLARNGLDLRGEDILEASKETGQPFDIRFHLHPSIKASLTKGARSVLLLFPTGLGWRMQVSDFKLSLEESIYAGSGKLQSTLQIVISGHNKQKHTVIKWKIARESGS